MGSHETALHPLALGDQAHLLDQLPTMVWISGLDGSGLWFNRAWLAFTGPRREAPAPHDWRDLAHPDDHARIATIALHAVERQIPFEHTSRMRRHDGEWRWLLNRGAPLLDSSGKCTKYIGSCQDVTEIHQSEVAARQAKEQMQLVFDHLAAAVFLITRDGRYLFVNREWERTFNPSGDMVTGRSIRDFFPPEKVDEILRTNEEVAASGSVTQYEMELPIEDGARTYFVKKFPLVSDTGELYAICGIATDIQAIKQSEADLRSMESHLRDAQKRESLAVLAGGLAHDFNNLLVGVLGNAGLALLDAPAGGLQHELLRKIEAAALRAADLTQQMLAYAGRGHLTLRPTDLSRLVRDQRQELESLGAPGTVLQLELDDDVPVVKADGGQIRTILAHLVTNAAEAFEGRPGAITIRTGACLFDPNSPRCPGCGDLPEGEYAFLEVVDAGTGMDAETQSRIFEPFFSTRFSGRGLGLPAALGIARAHRGALCVHSEPGRGTTMRLVVPRHPAVARSADPTPPPEQWRGAGVALIVDDDVAVLEVARAALVRAGFEVLCATSGAEGIARLREHRDEIVFVLHDLTMPDLNGLDFVERARTIGTNAQIVLTSGYSEREVPELLVTQGLAGFLPKPFELPQLLAWAHRAVERRANPPAGA